MLTVEELVRRVVDRWGTGSIEGHAEPQPHEARRLRLASEKAFSQLGWKSRLTADEAIALTVDWYKSDDKRRTTLEQVSGYLDRL
jgi:CDP-glucose 4,6-dehydratase